ncbi:MAG: hypothetical protein D6733_02020 [Methanobacteriota archaeon]|nr:MAG: hypothetical protein D6733_02020 [Euryarchaeota archaeon]
MKTLEASTIMRKKEPVSRDVRELQLKIIDLENKLATLEKKGARIRPIDLITISFFATINSAIIVVTILLLLFLKMKLL